MRILAIAPYEGLRILMQEIAEELHDIELDVQLGNLEEGARLAKLDRSVKYDFILSRGGTAELIEQIANIPVVEIKLSEYDILQAIKLAQSVTKKFCIVGFPSIISRVHTICSLMEYNIETRTIHTAEEVSGCLASLLQEKFELVVGDAITVATAKQMQLNGILITSSRDSVLAAVEEGRKIHRAIEMTTKRNLHFRSILNHSQLCVLVYDAERNLQYSNIDRQPDPGLYTPMMHHIESAIQHVFETGGTNLMRKSKGFLWPIRGVRVGEYAYFYISRLSEYTLPEYAVSVRDILTQEPAALNPFYRASGSMRKILAAGEEIGKTSLPVLMIGEPGTGKDTLAYSLHQQSPLQNNSFLTINCRLLSDKQLLHLFKSENSPLGETNMSIYFKSIQHLSLEGQQMMISYIKDTSLHRRNRIFYSYASQTPAVDHLLVDYLLGHSEPECVSLALPSLRERKDEIQGLASIYINELNITLGRQVAGLDAAALEALLDFDWPQNIDQFIRVLKELVLTAKDIFIRGEDVVQALQKERRFFSGSPDPTLLEGTLDEIISKVTKRVFEEENYNQTQAAKRLGISRSTMWRKLQM